MYILSFFKKGDTIQGGTLFKGEHYLRKYGICLDLSSFLLKFFFYYKKIVNEIRLIVNKMKRQCNKEYEEYSLI